MRSISTDSASPAVGPYSQAIECNGMLFISGQLPTDPSTGSVPEGTGAQAGRLLENVRAITEAAGYSLFDVVRTTLYLTDLSVFAEVNAVYAQYFRDPYPARSCVQVAALPKGAPMMMDAILVRQREK